MLFSAPARRIYRPRPRIVRLQERIFDRRHADPDPVQDIEQLSDKGIQCQGKARRGYRKHHFLFLPTAAGADNPAGQQIILLQPL